MIKHKDGYSDQSLTELSASSDQSHSKIPAIAAVATLGVLAIAGTILCIKSDRTYSRLAVLQQTWRDTSADDKLVAEWYLRKLRSSEQATKYADMPDQIIQYKLAADPVKLRDARAFYDLEMEAEAERKSGRAFDGSDSPKVPLKWEALNDFQRAAVDHKLASFPIISAAEREFKRSQLLEDVNNLQGMINEYRDSLEQKRGFAR